MLTSEANLRDDTDLDDVLLPFGRPDHDEEPSTAAPGHTRSAAVVLVASVAVPMVVAAVSALRETWIPIGDEAVIALRSAEIASQPIPLIGVYSTHGWAHPGPALFWLLAGPAHLVDGSTTVLFAAAGVLSALCAAAVGLAAWRRGGLGLVAVSMVGLAWLAHGLRPDTLVSFWNPNVALLPYVLFLFAAWSVACRDWMWLPVAAGTASVLVQLHVAYACLVGAAALVVLGHLVVTANADPANADPGNGVARWPRPTAMGATAALLVGLWAPVLVDQLVGSGNATKVATHFARNQESTAGAATGFGILSRHLGLTAPWTGGDEVTVFGDVQPGSLTTVVVLVLVMAGVAVLCAWRRQVGAVAVALAGAQVIAGGLAAGRIQQPRFPYLVVWMLPLAMFVWVALAWAIWSLRHAPGKTSRQGARPALVVVALVLIIVPLARTGAAWVNPELPRQHQLIPEAVQVVVATLEPRFHPGASLRIETSGDYLAEGSAGVMAALIRDGYRVYTSDGAAGLKWGEARVWRDQHVDATLTIAVGPGSDTDAVDLCEHVPEVRRIAGFDALDPTQRSERRDLAVRKFLSKGDLPADEDHRLEQLEARAYRLAVFEGPAVCGQP